LKLSIHQTDFWPWAGLFNKIATSDKFVVFDCVQAPRGKSWFSRNRILLQGGPAWITLPIYRSSNQKIFEVRINDEVNYRAKHLGTLRQAYAKTSYFQEVFDFVEGLYAAEHQFARDFSLSIISAVCRRLNIRTEFVEVRDLIPDSRISELRGNDLVLEICLAAKATSYLSGTGCLDFIKPEDFLLNKVSFEFQEFVQNEYPQPGCSTFHPSMSILDVLFCVGFRKTEEIIKGVLNS